MTEDSGARALVRTLVDAGIEVCFANPGTSEMHVVAALDDTPELRGVLALFEGVATGAADGYARMTGRPAAVLLHLGPGLGNGLANLHNARRAGTPVVVVVGDHALDHQALDAPLQSDIETVARNVSRWVRSSKRPEDVGRDAAEAIAAAAGAPSEVVTLLLPADVSWSAGGQPHPAIAPAPRTELRAHRVDGLAELLTACRDDDARQAMLLIGGAVVASEAGLVAAARVAEATGCRLLAPTFPARLRRGAGMPAVERLGYLAEAARSQLEGVTDLVLVDADAPVPFFAYPGASSRLLPDGASVHPFSDASEDGVGALEALAEALAAPGDVERQVPGDVGEVAAHLDAHTAAQVVAQLLPDEAVVVDEAVTSSLSLPAMTVGAPAHDWLCLTGGSIGWGLPCAVGAAIGAPDRKVLALQADGSALYTNQALWTMAREDLDVTVVLYNNASYEILKMERDRVGAQGEAGPASRALLELDGPRTDFVQLSSSMGVPATRATTSAEFADQLAEALAATGPRLVEAIIPPLFGGDQAQSG